MKIKQLTTLKHKLQWLLLLVALLGVSQGVWGTKIYLLTGSSNNPSTMTDVGYVDSDDEDFSWSINASTGGNVYFTVSSTTSYKNMYFQGEDKVKENYSIEKSSSKVNCGKQPYNLDNTTYHYCYLSVTENTTVTITYNTKNKKYTITDGGVVSNDKWYLIGEFTNWENNKIEFSKNGSTYTATAELPANTHYEPSDCCSGTTGFKICKNWVKNGGTWYGCNGTITTSISTPWDFVSDKNCGLYTGLAGTYTFSFTLNGSGQPQLTVTYPVGIPQAPTVRWGTKPVTDGEKNIKASAYIAAQGCDGNSKQLVTQIRVRFWKEGDESNIGYITATNNSGFGAAGTLFDVVDDTSGKTSIPMSNSILMSCTTPSTIYMELAGYNEEGGWSDYSDRVSITYVVNNAFIVTDLTESKSPNFTACDGEHQFNLCNSTKSNPMVQPAPGSDGWSVVQTESDYTTVITADAKSHFTESNGELIWKIDGKEDGHYYYKFTFTNASYSPTTATARLDINFTSAGTVIGDISDISATATEITPYKPITLSTSMTGNVTSVEWYAKKYVSSAMITINDPVGIVSSATFRAKTVGSQRTYTIYAKGKTSACGFTAEKSINIVVRPDTETCPAQ